MGCRVFSIAWKVIGKPILVLLHNLGMSLLVIWISFFRSTANQTLLSVAAVHILGVRLCIDLQSKEDIGFLEEIEYSKKTNCV